MSNKPTNAAERVGKWMTIHITIPIILFGIGLLTFPIGIIFMVIAVCLFLAGIGGNPKAPRQIDQSVRTYVEPLQHDANSDWTLP
jgi:hypothetical protein